MPAALQETFQLLIPVENEGATMHRREKRRDFWSNMITVPSLICPGHQAMAGSLMPPSNVVSFPQRNGPLLPPEE